MKNIEKLFTNVGVAVLGGCRVLLVGVAKSFFEKWIEINKTNKNVNKCQHIF